MFDTDCTTPTTYRNSITGQFGLGDIKGIWNNITWKLILHILDAQGPVLLPGLKTQRNMGIFMKHTKVYLYKQDWLVNLKRGKMVKTTLDPELPNIGNAHQALAKDWKGLLLMCMCTSSFRCTHKHQDYLALE